MKIDSVKESEVHDVFWDSDLSTIEASFLSKGKSITDLPTYLDEKVPHQGSVLLESIEQSEKLDSPSFWGYIKLIT